MSSISNNQNVMRIKAQFPQLSNTQCQRFRRNQRTQLWPNETQSQLYQDFYLCNRIQIQKKLLLFKQPVSNIKTLQNDETNPKAFVLLIKFSANEMHNAINVQMSFEKQTDVNFGSLQKIKPTKSTFEKTRKKYARDKYTHLRTKKQQFNKF